MPKMKPYIVPTLTFLAGLTTGALVFSAPSQPASEPEPPAAASEPVSVRSVDTGAVSEAEETAPQPAADAEPEPPIAAEPEEPPQPAPEVVARLEDLTDGWGRMQAELAELRQRVAMLEQRPAVPATDEAEEDRAPVARTPDEQRAALVAAGVSPDVADDILWRRSQLSLARLELNDQASREGWRNTERYRDELRRINEQRVSLRDELGSDAYDRYLYQSGEDNRIRVEGVIPGSAGEESGLQRGDVIEMYGDTPIFGARDLRSATTEGERGELVPVQVRRGGSIVEMWLPRGPIGIQLDSTRVEPRG